MRWSPLLVLLLVSGAADAFAQGAPPPQPNRIKLRFPTGTSPDKLQCLLYGPKGWLKRPTKIGIVVKDEAELTCVFVEMKPGTYAILVFRDEDGDEALARGWFGGPREPHWTSGRKQGGFFGMPRFEDAKVKYSSEVLTLDVRLAN